MYLSHTHTQVPKVLGVLVHTWAPQAMVVSFKLETDEHILIKKVRAIHTHTHTHAHIHGVIG